MTYSEKLRDPRWQRKKTEVLRRDKFICKSCKDKDETLQVHHIIYRKGLEPYEHDIKDLITFCETCHKEVTDYKRIIKEYIDLNFITSNQLFELYELMFYTKKLNITEIKQMTKKAESLYNKKQVKKDGKTDKE